MSTHAIHVPVEADGVTYEFEGADAEERHDHWALTGDPVYDRVTPGVEPVEGLPDELDAGL